jgi:DNA-directed RNA polymerase specialized sigma24 family protein
MCESTTNTVARQWFAVHIARAYLTARHQVVRLLDRAGYDYTPSDVEELIQDTVCRGYASFCKVVLSKATVKNMEHWIYRCVVLASRDAVRNRSTFGSVSSHTAVRDDAMNRLHRVIPTGPHGTDGEMDVEYVPVVPEAQRWEIEAEIERQGIPKKLRMTAVYEALDFTQEDSAKLQGCTDRTVRNHLSQIRAFLDPEAESWYVIIVDALKESLADRAWTTA